MVVLKGGGLDLRWCVQCASEQEMIAIENAGVVTNLDQAAVEEWLNSSQLHVSEGKGSSPLVCLRSLLASVKVPKIS